MCPGFFDGYPMCKAVHAHVAALPSVREYLARIMIMIIVIVRTMAITTIITIIASC